LIPTNDSNPATRFNTGSSGDTGTTTGAGAACAVTAAVKTGAERVAGVEPALAVPPVESVLAAELGLLITEAGRIPTAAALEPALPGVPVLAVVGGPEPAAPAE
jgi:hypothetical protein